MASRTLDCTGNEDLANKRFEQYLQQLSCTVDNPQLAPVDQYLQCATQMNQLSCDALASFGSDIVAATSAASPQCSRIFEEIVGAVKPDDWAPPNNGLGVELFPNYQLLSPGTCPVQAAGSPITVTINNPRAQAVAAFAVSLPCEESHHATVIGPGQSGDFTAAQNSALRVRSLEGALLYDGVVVPNAVAEVPQ